MSKFYITYLLMLASMAREGNWGSVVKGTMVLWLLIPKKLLERRKIMGLKQVTSQYLVSIFYPDLPPDRHKLRKLRAKVMFWKQA